MKIKINVDFEQMKRQLKFASYHNLRYLSQNFIAYFYWKKYKIKKPKILCFTDVSLNVFIKKILLINAGVFFSQNTSLLSPAAVPPQVGETIVFVSTEPEFLNF